VLIISQVIALYNGGAPGVIYEFIAVSIFYWMIAACIAEMASAIPSSAGVYHWASVTGGRHGRVIGYFAGWYVTPNSFHKLKKIRRVA
jgi:choline transport protein